MPMTCVFAMDAEDFNGNPFKAGTPFGQPVTVSKGDVCAESDKQREAAESALSWLDNWAKHVGSCSDGQVCTCGLDAIRHELIVSLQPST